MQGSAVCAMMCYFALALAGVIMFGCAFTTLPQNHVGLKFNSITRSYDNEEVYGPGRYFVGLGRTMVAFPTTWQKLSFGSGGENGAAITGRVGVGASAVSVHVSLTVYYKLRIERLPEIIAFFPTLNWQARYETIVKNAVSVMMGSGALSVEDFFTNRPYVAKCMGWAINERLLPVYSYISAVYVQNIGLGSQQHSSIDQVYLDKQISVRRAITSEVEGQMQVIQAEADQLVSAIKATEKKLLDNTMKITNFTAAEYAARGDQMLLSAQGDAYLYLQARLNLSQTDLIKFIYLDRVGKEVNDVVAGFDSVKYDAMVTTT